MKCPACQQETSESDGCAGRTYRLESDKADPIAFGSENPPLTRDEYRNFVEEQLAEGTADGNNLVAALNAQLEVTDAPTDEDTRCFDCDARIGQNHHVGCSVEQCPFCDNPLFACDCEVQFALEPAK